MRPATVRPPRIVAAGFAALLAVVLAALIAAAPALADTTLTIDTPADGPEVTVTPVAVDFTVTDPPLNYDIQCRIDGHQWEGCGDPGIVSGVRQNGPYVLDARVVDNPGKQVVATATRSFTVNDTTAPVFGPITGVDTGAPITDVSEIDPSWPGGEPYADWRCRLDGAPLNCGSWGVSIDYISSGTHTLTVTATDPVGNAHAQSVQFVLDDDTPPSLSITSPTDGGTYPDSSSPPTIEYTVSDDADTLLCAYDDMPLDYCSNRPRLGNGAHTATVVAADRAGNQATAAAGFTIDDTTDPTITVTAPAEGQIYTGGSVQAMFSGSDQRARYFISVDGGPFTLMTQYGIWNFPPYLPNGPHTATFRVVDGAGNSATLTRNFVVNDLMPPSVSTISPPDGSVVPYRHIGAGFSSSDSTGGICQVDSAPPFPCQPSNTYQLGHLPPGVHTFKVTAIDQAGNQSAPAITTFTVDDSHLGTFGLTPADGAVYTAQPVLRLQIGFSPSGDCSVNGGPFTTCSEGQLLPGIGNGAWSLTVRAQEGSDQYEAEVDFTVNDTSPPVDLDVDFPAEGETVTNLVDFDPSYEAVDFDAENRNVGAARVLCSLDNGTAVECHALVTPSRPLAPGPHVLTVLAYDWVGNVTQKAVSFDAADATAPLIKIISPAGGASIGSGSPGLLFWTDEPSADFTCRADSRPPKSCASLTGWHALDLGESPLGPGDHTLSVTGTDAAGNSATVSVTVSLDDVTAPALTLVEDPADSFGNTPSVTWISDEPVVRVRCWIGASAPDPYAADPGCGVPNFDRRSGTFRPTSLSGTPPLEFTVEVSDAAGNVTVDSVMIDFQDVTPPTITIGKFTAPQGAEVETDSPVAVQFTADDSSAAYECAVVAAPGPPAPEDYSTCAPGTWNFPPPADGQRALFIRGVDPSGNDSVASTTFTVTDTTAPRLEMSIDDTPVLDNMLVPAAFDLEIEHSGALLVLCSIDGATAFSCFGGIVSVDFPTSGPHTIAVTATDASSNTTTRNLKLQVNPATAPPPPEPPVTPPADGLPVAPPPPPAAPKANFVKPKPKFRGRNVRIPLRVNLTLPTGTAADACAGAASVRAKVGRKVVKKAAARLRPSSGRCSVAVTLSIKKKLVAGKKVSLSVAFGGNASLGAFTATRSVKIKKR